MELSTELTVIGVILTALMAIGGAWAASHKISNVIRRDYEGKIGDAEKRTTDHLADRAKVRDEQIATLNRDVDKLWSEITSLRSQMVHVDKFETSMSEIRTRLDNIMALMVKTASA
jgi:predicted  nucleic acid-binding Zn-ribbon protein